MVFLSFKVSDYGPDKIASQCILSDFLAGLVKRASAPWSFSRKPFNDVRLLRDGDAFFFSLEHSWPALWLYAVIAMFLVLLTGLPNWLLFPLGFMASLVVFWSPGFYYIMFMLGLRKAGFKGKLKMLSDRAALLEVLGWGR